MARRAPGLPQNVLIPQDVPAIMLDEMPDSEGKVFLKIPYPYEGYPVDNWLVAAFWTVPKRSLLIGAYLFRGR